MPSANGYKLIFPPFELVASWPAKYFTLNDSDYRESIECGEPAVKPFLYHAETLKDAKRHSGIILNSDFTIYKG